MDHTNHNRIVKVPAAPTIIRRLTAEVARLVHAPPPNDEFFWSLGDALLDIYEHSPHLEGVNRLLHFVDGDHSELDLINILSKQEYRLAVELRNVRNLRRLRHAFDQSYKYAYYVSRNLFECELLLAVARKP